MKTVLFLAGDHWHPADTIQPLAEILFPADEWKLVFTTDPAELYACPEPDLFVSFKDPSEDNRIPTPVWCDSEWTDNLLNRVRSGLGLIAVHAALVDLKETHPIVKELTHTVFLTHPQPCKVSVHILKDHPVTAGVKDFTLPDPDEHYQMKMVGGEDTVMLAETVSQHGTQPGLWVSGYGKGRICCFTPAHTTPSLTCEGYVQIMKNAVTWCCRK